MLPCSTAALLLLIVLHVHCSNPSCRIGTKTDCDAAPFVPGHELVGESFDIVTLQRKGVPVLDVKTYLSSGESCTLCPNPLQKDTYQKLPQFVVDWSASSQCSPDIISSHHTSVSSLIKAYVSQDINDWMFGLEFEKNLFDNFDVGGTGSNAYKFVSYRRKEDRYTFSINSVTCNHYGFILSTTPALSVEFKKHLERLPSHYDSSTKNVYRKFINAYGTHYFRMVNLGGRLRRVTSSRSCLSSLNGLTSIEMHSCLSMGVAVGLGKLKISSVEKSCIGVLKNQDSATGYRSGLHQHLSEVSGGDGWLGEISISKDYSKAYMNWLKSLKDHPDVVSYSLRPLYQLVSDTFRKAALKAAIEQYVKDNAMKKLPEEPHCESNDPNLSSNCCPVNASRGTLSVNINRAWNLYGDPVGTTDGYAILRFNSKFGMTHTIQSNNPQWNARYHIGKVDARLVLRIEVWDEDWLYWREDDLLVSCEKYLNPGTHTFTCSSSLGSVEFSYTLICDPYLTGEKCSRYKPSP